MAKNKNISTASTDTLSAENVGVVAASQETPVAKAPEKVFITVNIGGVLTEVEIADPAEAAKIAAAVAPKAKEAKEMERKETARLARLKKAEELKESRKDDPVYLEKLAKREANKAARAQTEETRSKNRDARQARNDAAISFKKEIHELSGTSIPMDRIEVCEIRRKFSHGTALTDTPVQRGWVANLVTVNSKGVKSTQKIVKDLDVEGVGTLETSYNDAKSALIEMLAELR